MRDSTEVTCAATAGRDSVLEGLALRAGVGGFSSLDSREANRDSVSEGTGAAAVAEGGAELAEGIALTSGGGGWPLRTPR